MATAKLGKSIDINETDDGRMRILSSACRCLDDGGREVETDEIQVEIFIPKAEYLSSTGKQILDKLRAEVSKLASSENAVLAQKRFAGLTIS